MSKNLYIGIYAASFGLCCLTIIGQSGWLVFGLIQKSDAAVNEAIAAAGFGIYVYLQFVVVHAIYNFLLLARMWEAIQDGQTTITVGRAIGFLFIPFFNIYWIFRAWGSYPTEYNSYIDRYDLPVPQLAEKFFVAYPVLLLLAGILYVPLFALPFAFIAVASKACDAVSRLEEAVSARRNELLAIQPLNQFYGEKIKKYKE